MFQVSDISCITTDTNLTADLLEVIPVCELEQISNVSFYSHLSLSLGGGRGGRGIGSSS